MVEHGPRKQFNILTNTCNMLMICICVVNMTTFVREKFMRERENLFDFALLTDTIIRSTKHTKKSLVAKAWGYRGTFRLSSRDAP